MKTSALSLLLAAAPAALAHYTFPTIDGTGSWINVRRTTNYQSHGPIQDVSDTQMRCYQDPAGPAATTLTVKAGDKVTFGVDPKIQHPGPTMFYMAKVPSGQSVNTFDGSGNVWFKIFEAGPSSYEGNGLTWPSDNQVELSATIPKNTPSGDYLVRVEHIGLHSASQVGGAQFYLACGQVTVTNGGSGTPTPLVSFPGAYKATDPGIQINLYYPVPTNYVIPGPKVWTG